MSANTKNMLSAENDQYKTMTIFKGPNPGTHIDADKYLAKSRLLSRCGGQDKPTTGLSFSFFNLQSIHHHYRHLLRRAKNETDLLLESLLSRCSLWSCLKEDSVC